VILPTPVIFSCIFWYYYP